MDKHTPSWLCYFISATENSHLELFLGPQWASKTAMNLALLLELCDYTSEFALPLHWRRDAVYVDFLCENKL